MARKRKDELSQFERAMETGDVRPMEGRDNVRPTPPPVVRTPSANAPTAPRFEVEEHGDRIEGRAKGIDRKQLLNLRKGGFEIEARVDLHGLRSDAARQALRGALLRAGESGVRCVLVIHGRGRHSEGASVLKQSLPEWLAEPPLGRQVMAFASALDRDGGPGATYVLLRRRR